MTTPYRSSLVRRITRVCTPRGAGCDISSRFESRIVVSARRVNHESLSAHRDDHDPPAAAAAGIN
jgi:hypothetical protein